MPRPSLTILAMAALLSIGGASTGRAHDGHDHELLGAHHIARNQRTWTDASGAFHLQGSFVSSKDGRVTIRKGDGTLRDLRLGAISRPDRDWVASRVAEIRRLNDEDHIIVLAQGSDPGPKTGSARKSTDPANAPSIYATFKPFADKLELRWDHDYFFVGSNGIPDHRMMVGITAWQQQVPLPQSYKGENAWRIPLRPVPAKYPLSAKDNFFRGAIALAANGVPIFNPIKNDGRTDTLLAGELDEFGGHCGRADDYHYHIAPVHLELKIGKGKPLAYALDGYPIYGYEEPDGSRPKRLDHFNGHEDDRKPYHYHATKDYPYLNGGFHGEVTERDGQVDPQPRAEPVREALAPLDGATITDFQSLRPGRYSLTYQIDGRKNRVNYSSGEKGAVTFEFIDSGGKSRIETYERREQGPRDRPPPPPPRPRRRRLSDLSREPIFYAIAALPLGGLSAYAILRGRRRR